MKSPHRLWVCVALALLTLGLYSPSLSHDFLTYDDQQYVTENPHVRAGLTGPGVGWAFTRFYASNWHPLTWLSHMLDCQLYGLRPAGHHLTNVLLHIANTLLLFQVLLLMTGAVWRSAFVAALFAWHPLHVESVAWVAERKDVLSALFWLATLWAYAAYAAKRGSADIGEQRGEGRRRRVCSGSPLTNGQSDKRAGASRYYLLALFFFGLGLMSKPMVVTLPFVLLLVDFWPLKRTKLLPGGPDGEPAAGGPAPISLGRLCMEKVPFFALSAVGCVLTLLAQQRGSSIVPTAQLSLGSRVTNGLVAYLHYIGATLFPRDLSIFYPYPAVRPVTQTAAALLLLGLISILAFWSAQRRPYVLVGWLWYVGTLVPAIGLIQVGQQAWADRYTYLPLIGLFVIIAWGLGEFASLLKARKLAETTPVEPLTPRPPRTTPGTVILASAAICLTGALLTATLLQQRFWKDTQRLFEHAARVTPNNFLAASILASLRVEKEQPDEAIILCRQALGYKPTCAPAHFFLGRALEQKGELNEAVSEYQEALRLEPRFSQAHIFIGLALARQNQFDSAAVHYRSALKIDPDSATAENNLARLLHSQGKLEDAIAHYTKALKLDPDLVQAQNNLGVLLVQKGELAEGVGHLRAAVRLKPSDSESRYNLALALNQHCQWREAAELLGKLASGRTQDAAFHFQFGEALAHLGDSREAMSHYAQSILLKPDFPEALDSLSWLLATSSKPEFRNGPEAVRMAERACELTGRKQPSMLATLAAACAEDGRFEEAVVAAKQAQALAARAGRAAVAQKCQAVLEAVQSRKPFREEY
ncbi:MAG TPA: tetratricopeptide repeat protein [Candidatus Acidoferrum sp.]|nr:tetratricopeptide repeat protein [Candidatus Acidoferrum sp.]